MSRLQLRLGAYPHPFLDANMARVDLRGSEVVVQICKSSRSAVSFLMENLSMKIYGKRAYEDVSLVLEIVAEANIRLRVLYVHRCSNNE